MLLTIEKKEKKSSGRLDQRVGNGPWVVYGDFNTVRYPSEKKNCGRISKAMNDFSEFIMDLNLLDPQLECGKYTWRKGDRHDVAARLDRFLVSNEWDEGSKNIKQSVLPKVASDHTLIMSQCGNWEPAKSYFKFENWCLHTEGFLERVKEWDFSKSGQGNLALQKQSILGQLAELEETQDQRILNEEEIHSKAELLLEFENIAKYEEISWRQRSRVNWLKQGDNNTKFFHRTANAHKRYNSIDELNVNGEAVKSPEVIKKAIVDFYRELYTETETWRPLGNCRGGQIISEEDNIMLQKEFEDQEI
ncbi:hypothetical protein KY289_016264 [Solanum tuberosum]|nr:hypothetical protein KY289_016264 [Solanum tuberosum]